MRRAILLLLLATIISAADLAIPARGTPAFTLTAPTGWSVAAGADGSTTLKCPQQAPHIVIWAVAGKRSVDQAVADLAAILAPEVKDFVIAQRSELTIAGAKAQLLVGTGIKADDGDPSNAQATVFTVGGTVWVLLSHGEGDGAAARAADLASIFKLLVVASGR